MTLEKYLTARLNAPSDEGFSFGKMVSKLEGVVQNREAYNQAKLLAAELDFEDTIAHSENFSVRPLPKGSYTEDQIVQYVKEFYEGQGFKYDEENSDVISWWATLIFKREPNEEMLATLSIYPLYGRDTKNDELLVTTELDKY